MLVFTHQLLTEYIPSWDPDLFLGTAPLSVHQVLESTASHPGVQETMDMIGRSTLNPHRGGESRVQPLQQCFPPKHQLSIAGTSVNVVSHEQSGD